MLSYVKIHDNNTLLGEIIEFLLNFIFWAFFLDIISKFLIKLFSNKIWFNNIKKQPGGIKEFLIMSRVLPQHFTCAFLIWLSIYSNNSYLFRTGLLVESGYEGFDLFRCYYEYFNNKLDSKNATKTILTS